MSVGSPEAYEQFLHLAETLHFSRTAEALHMSPSALTRAIQRLEEELGHRLFERDQRNVALTRAGELFREHARAQVAAHRQLLDALAAERGSPSGELRIACTVTACHSVLPALLARSRARYPELSLQLRTGDAARSMQQLEGGEVDLAVVPAPDADDPELTTMELARTSLTFVAPAADPALQRRLRRGGGALDGLPVILPRRGVERTRADHYFARAGVQPAVYAEVDGNEAILAMVSLGCGVGLVPELVRLGSPLRDVIRAVKVTHPPEGYGVVLCARRRTLQRRAVAAFWELTRERA
ncbi:MAG: HTH-type transcriptional activator IlvY [Myxococcales bacterium]|jgi:LysR family positive regulator for ilvC